MICVFNYMTGAPEGSLKVVLWRSWELILRPLVYKALAYPLHHGGVWADRQSQYNRTYKVRNSSYYTYQILIYYLPSPSLEISPMSAMK